MQTEEKEKEDMNVVDKVTTAARWWDRNKSYIYGILLLLAGILGGNVDRIPIPAMLELPSKVEELEVRVEKLEQLADGEENNDSIRINN